ncbi:MAG TPA: 5'-3' exonuclease H3TH domain-containing protein [Mycobacterium sp.]|nr:5'-3' exonuclease H3TH domain-containing protein [Mycobacterium sp.]
MTVAAAQQSAPEVLLIDLSSLFWNAWHATAATATSEAGKIAVDAVRRCVGDNDGKLVAICCDSGKSFRKDLLPAYKAQRPEKDQSAYNELGQLKKRLADDGYLLWGVDGFEADDVIATAATLASKAGHPVRIASADKDLLQLLALPNTTALRTHNWSTVTAKEVVAKFGIEPDGLRDWLALVGDASDNIKGCPGVGPKTATKLLLENYDIDGLYRRIDAIPGGATMTPEARAVSTPAILQALKDNRESVLLARKLVELRTDAPIEFDEIYERREPKTTTTAEDFMSQGPIDADFSDDRISTPPTPTPEAPKAEPTKADAAPPAPTPAPLQPSEPVTALTVQGPFEMQLEPMSLPQAFMLGKALYDSRLYTRFPNAQAITAVMIRGREMGVPALTALDCFHVIEGKPAPHAHFIAARAEAHTDCEYFMFVGGDATYAEYETKRRSQPKPIRHRYTIDDAVAAGLCLKEAAVRMAPMDQKDHRGNWDKRRAEMLRKTAAVQLARIAYPGAAMGLYSVEELGGDA